MVRRLCDGEIGPVRDIVTLNAAAALVVADLAADLAEGLELARTVLDDGRAAGTLEAFTRVSRDARAEEG